ncbi:MAG: VPLPA-CTERM sorting domain-containing protein [Parvularcula sp.]|jgi:hypothetical protein|nr:VPLPA-CTERM sorting domain-containing protein [Parvularcula sp.]
MLKRFLAGALSAVFLGGAASASIVGVGGAGLVFDTTGLTEVTNATPGSNTNILGFDERQNVAVTTDLFVDSGVNLNGLTVDSHMIFLNRATGSSLLDLTANFSFAGKILGVMTSRNGELHAASDQILGLAGVTYDTFNNRGFENTQDTVSFIGTELTTRMYVTQPGDWMRVVTEAAVVPLPAAGWMLLAGVGGLAAMKRRRKIAS